MADAPGGDGGGVDPRDPRDNTDPWSSISFDEDFVKASNITELAAGERAKAAKKAAAKDAAKRRRRERRRRAGVFVRRYTLIWVAIAIVAVLGVMGAKGTGPLGSILHVRNGRSSDESAGPRSSTSSTSSTSTTLALYGYRASPGECLTWDQGIASNPRRDIRSVDCAEPHLFEATGSFTLKDEGYGPDGPTREQWGVIGSTNCPGYAEKFLGYPIDENGRFNADAIHPLPDAWRSGYREVQCGIFLTRVTVPPDGAAPEWTPEFTGAVEGADQARFWGTGSCVLTGFGMGYVVDCAAPHSWEVAGTFDLPFGPDAPYPGTEAMSAAATDACRSLASDVYGRSLPRDIGWTSTGIPESSWALGRRTVECIFGRSDGSNNWVPVAGPLRG